MLHLARILAMRPKLMISLIPRNLPLDQITILKRTHPLVDLLLAKHLAKRPEEMTLSITTKTKAPLPVPVEINNDNKDKSPWNVLRQKVVPQEKR